MLVTERYRNFTGVKRSQAYKGVDTLTYKDQADIEYRQTYT
jgi:hypothetical protein